MNGLRNVALRITVLVGIASLLAIGLTVSAGAAVKGKPAPPVRVTVPADIHRACSVTNAALRAAAHDAARDNARLDQSKLAHPVRATDEWNLRRQNDLSSSAAAVANAHPADRWATLGEALGEASYRLDPVNDVSSVDREAAFAEASGVCVGR